MNNNRDQSEDYLTFSQRYGYEPLPVSMQLEELSDDLRRELWNVTRKLLLSLRGNNALFAARFEEGTLFIERVLGKSLKKPEDEISTSYESAKNDFKNLILQGSFNEVLDLVEVMVNERRYDKEFVKRIIELFETHVVAYWLDKSKHPYQFFPRSNEAQGEATREAIKTIRDGGMEGPETHLRQAAEHINAQRFAESIKDSIHAVESVARRIDPKSKPLAPVLNSLEKAGLIKHPALKKAFSKLYGYTSDEQGIRHALLDKNAPDVDLDEAMFMFGACASFAAYLVNKHHKMQEEDDK